MSRGGAISLRSAVPSSRINMDHVFLPGTNVTEEITGFTQDPSVKFVLGPGLIRKEKNVFTTTAGRLMHRNDPLVFWIDSNQRRVSNCFPHSFISHYRDQNRNDLEVFIINF